MSTDFSGMIDFATRLADTVRQAQAATEALANANAKIAQLEHQLEAAAKDRDNWSHYAAETDTKLQNALRDGNEARTRAAEVSEALAAVNAKLDTFRGMLGLDVRPSAAGPREAAPAPAVDPVPVPQPDHEGGAPHAAQPVEPVPPPGAGGLDALEVAPVTDPLPTGGTSSDLSTSNTIPSAPEVAEPHPTSASGGDGPTAEPTQPWRNSDTYVGGWRPFSG